MPVKVPEILLPKNCDLTLWAAVACDQFTSQPEYWQELEQLVGEKPSTLHLIFPEVYLGKNDSGRIKKINKTMHSYLEEELFGEPIKSFILVERTYASGKKRLALMAAVDLEEYSYIDADKKLIRASEGTILDRLPPRIKIRRDAPLEFPHIMLLIDDIDKTVIEPLANSLNGSQPLYDFELNMGGGHLKGYKIDDSQKVIDKINALLNEQTLIKKYGRCERFLFAVGDGNHSLATAKQCWEKLKPTLEESQIKTHPARFALCEIVNLYDEGLEFEPIHRYIEGIDTNKFISGMPNLEEGLKCRMFCGGKKMEYQTYTDTAKAIAAADDYISAFIQENGGNVDYIHGGEELYNLTLKNKNSVGLMMPSLDKEKLFLTIADNGSLPRKTFSMGEAQEKRYYLEGKKITQV